MQLYQQLAESRVAGQKNSASQSSHVHADMHPQHPQQHEEQQHRHMHVSRMDISHSESSHKESHFDKHEMYRLERVLCALRKNGQLKKARPGLQFRPGKYYEIAGCFKPADSGAPEGYLWLHAKEPEIRLLCHKMVFSAEQEHAAFEEIWACGEALPLRGVVLSLRCAEALCGLPLALWMS